MTNEQLFKALGEVDEAMLDENVETITITRTPKRRFALWAGTAAACICLCAVGANVLPGMLPRTEGGGMGESSAVSTDTTDTICDNFWVPLENGIRYETVFCGTGLEDPEHFQAIHFILDPWHMEYQIIDPMASGNAEIERGTYTIENGIYTLSSPDGKTSQLEAVEDTSEWKWELKVLSCDSFPDYVGIHFSSRISSTRLFEPEYTRTITSAQAGDVQLDEQQVTDLLSFLINAYSYQSITPPAEEMNMITAQFTLSDGTEIEIYNEWISVDGITHLTDAEQMAKLTMLYEEIKASSAVDSWKPFADYDASAFSAIYVYYPTEGDQEIIMLEKEIPTLTAMLQEITVYGEDPDFYETEGMTQYSLTMEHTDGNTTYIGIYEDHIIVDDDFGDTFYTADTEDCRAVREWLDVLQSNAIAQGWGTEEPPFGEEGAMQPFTDLADDNILSGYILNEQDGSETAIPAENLSALATALQELTVYTEDQETTASRNTDASWYRMVFTLADGTELSYRCTSEDENMLWIDGTFYWIYSEDYTAVCTHAGSHAQLTDPEEVITFVGTITAISGNSITVGAVVNGGSIELGESEPSVLYSFSAEGLLMHDAGGAALTLSDFAVGDTVYVSYTGEVLESDPCWIVTPTKLQLHE